MLQKLKQKEEVLGSKSKVLLKKKNRHAQKSLGLETAKIPKGN